MKLTIVGCGDAFGSGGRLQTCFHVAAGDEHALIDCGATAILGCNRFGIDLNRISAVFVSHLHGDHFSGLIWLLIHAVHVSGRRTPLTVTGPAGIARRFHMAAEALFAGSTQTVRKFDLTFLEYGDWKEIRVGGFTVSALEVCHPSGAPSYGLRIEAGGKTLAFSGDTEWVPNLIPLSANSDLFITECYGFDRSAKYHMDWVGIRAKLSEITASRILLTHMNAEMLAHQSEVSEPRVSVAHDGLVMDI